MPQSIYPWQIFPIDHILSKQHGGDSRETNLALSCLHCNLFKGPNIAGFDPKTGRVERLFHPRKDRWRDHFRWSQATLIGKTSIGRVTVIVLKLNHPDLVAIRMERLDQGESL